MKQVYLDNAATTPVRLEVEVAMRPYFCEKYGNPSGVNQMSSENRGMIENVREQIAKTLNASAEEIYFTSGGTESDNWAIKAAAQMLKEKGCFSILSLGVLRNASKRSEKSIMPQETIYKSPKPLFIKNSPIAGAHAVARAVAIPKMPIPSAKRGLGITSVATVDVEVFEQAREIPCTTRIITARKTDAANV